MRYASRLLQLLVFIGISAQAVENLTVTVPQVRVYSGANVMSPVITVLQKGQTVQAGSNPAGGFKKVLVTDKSGKKRIGYVSIMELTRGSSATTTVAKSKNFRSARGPVKGLHGAYALALNLGVNYIMQSNRPITDSSGATGSVANPSGANLGFGASFYVPFRPRFTLVFDLNYKPTSFTGNFTYNGSSVPVNAVLAQNFISVGAFAKIYSGPNDNFWYGLGLQDDHGLSSTFQLGTNTATTANSNDFVFLYATTGYDFTAGKSFYIIPSFRLGSLINSSPMSFELDAFISGAFRF